MSQDSLKRDIVRTAKAHKEKLLALCADIGQAINTVDLIIAHVSSDKPVDRCPLPNGLELCSSVMRQAERLDSRIMALAIVETED